MGSQSGQTAGFSNQNQLSFMKFYRALTTVAACLLAATTAKATLLTPGNTIGLSLGSGPVGASLLAATNVSFNGVDSGNNVLFSGTLTSSVYSGDTSNPFGGLTFTYQLTSNPSSVNAIDRMTLNRFSGFQTDISYSDSGVVPIRATRTGGSGDLIAFVFENASFQPILTPGSSSVLLVIQTDSTVWDIGNGSVIDGATANVPVFVPLAVPEPTTLALLALGAAALMARRKA